MGEGTGITAFGATAGVGSIDPAAWTQTVKVARTAVNADGQTVLTKDPDDKAYTNDYVTKAIEKGYAVGKGRIPLDHFYRHKIEAPARGVHEVPQHGMHPAAEPAAH